MCQHSRRLTKYLCLVMTGLFSVLATNAQESRQLMGLNQLNQNHQYSFTSESVEIQKIVGYLKSKQESTSLQNFKINPIDKKIKNSQELKPLLIQPTNKNMGGVSDGGGNAVGSQLFDFYENEGSFHFKPDQIVLWNSEVLKLIQKANKFIPRLSVSGRGLGEDILLSIKSKKWILESKEITGASCRNESLVQTLNQKIVGCQNMFEVRLSAHWLVQEADVKNQAGLILHEAILSWLRDLEKASDSSKENLEFKVREVNRLIHADLSEEDFQSEFSRIFPQYTVFTQKDIDFENQLPAFAAKVKVNFCQLKTTDDYVTVLNLYKENSKQYNLIKQHFDLYLGIVRMSARYDAINKVSGQKSNVDSAKEYISKVSSYCNEQSKNFEYLEKIPLNLEMLSEQCKKNVEEAFDYYLHVSEISSAEIIDKGSSVILKKGVENAAEVSALFCSGMKGIELQRTAVWPFMTEDRGRKIMKDVENQALKYFIELKKAYVEKKN